MWERRPTRWKGRRHLTGALHAARWKAASHSVVSRCTSLPGKCGHMSYRVVVILAVFALHVLYN